MLDEFHSRSGFYFKRMEDGSVRVRVTETGIAESPTAREITLPANEWASVVASVSKSGEDAVSWHAALDFHNADGHERS